jgi:hypothetical protein
MINIKNIIETEGQVRKFVGNAPEGFVLVHEKTIEDLKEFDTWKDWKNGFISLKDLDKKNFDNS